MSSATVQINVVPKRLLRKGEAASYCGRSVKRFEAEAPCPMATGFTMCKTAIAGLTA
jgi:hypothetical protein